jgi:MazG family protein
MSTSKREPKAPDLEKAKESFGEFLSTIASLRHPETGCPWDNEQSHESLTKYMIEEAYEASEAMSSGDPKEISDELGDVLLQVVLNSQVALDEGNFSIVDVIDLINSKMRRRHPHVFGSASRDKNEIKKTWQKIKAEERGSSEEDAKKGIFESAKVHKVRPANLQAHKIGEIARRIDFDWKNLGDILSTFNSEVSELNEALSNGTDSKENLENIYDELGDVYFSLSQLSRHLGVNGEMIAQRGNQKFLRRFASLEKLAASKGVDVEDTDLSTLERLWAEAKSLER